MLLIRLSARSLFNRKLTTLLTLFSVTVSVMLLMAVETIRMTAKESFQSTISGTDLVVGARSGSIPLLLFSVFGIGNPEQNLSWKTYEHFGQHPEVASAVPISLGDSHKSYRVVATTPQYFSFYGFSDDRALSFDQGAPFAETQEAVIGFEVARKLGYRPGREIHLSHGTAEVSFEQHEEHPFVIRGILQQTGTPVDLAIFVPIEAMSLLHESRSAGILPEESEQELSAFFLKLRSKISVLQMQREINEYGNEPLTAIIPGRSMQELWKIVSVLERAFLAVSFVTFILSLTGMFLVFITTLTERKREMAILRTVGARPWFLASLLLSEAGLLAVAGSGLSLILLQVIFGITGPWIESKLGLQLALTGFLPVQWKFLCAVTVAVVLSALTPALQIYRDSLNEALTVKL
ncbi:ABC transporter permease [bacterium]|nr:ABC transporter permease [bacterium]